jgi:uncharacterized protein (TIGR03503 family)
MAALISTRIRIGLRRFTLAWLALMLSYPVMAAQSGGEGEESARTDGIAVLGNQNQLPILDNRFRIDDNVKEITLLFFRERGTPPVILVKPDGSKMYASMALTGEAQWFDETTYDLIKIENPMPGPWQAVGNLTKGSKVLIITDFELNVDDLPPILIQGETIKLTGHVTNNGQPIKARNFKDVITLNVDFVSTNNKKYRNVGAGLEEVTSFVDDGKGYDERARDGVFTGEFNLSFASGEWVPKYYIRTPLMQRELEHDPVMVSPNPIHLSIETTDVADEFHKLKIDIVGDYVDKESIIIQGKVFYPNQEVQSFSITEKSAEQRIFNVINYDFGLYRITLSAFGETVNGRGVMLSIPDFTFAIDPPQLEDTVTPEEAAKAKTLADLAIVEAQKPEPEPVDHTMSYIIIGVGYVLFMILGIIIYVVMVRGKSLKFKMPSMSLPKFSFKRKSKGGDDDDDDGKGGKGKKSSDDDDILDLSLPDG